MKGAGMVSGVAIHRFYWLPFPTSYMLYPNNKIPSPTLKLTLRPLPQLLRQFTVRPGLTSRCRQDANGLIQFAVSDGPFVAGGGPEHVVAAL